MEYFDFWNTENEMVKGVYDSENIRVLDYSEKKVCYIFFSSNGLYYPNTLSEFEEKVIRKNRYEWENMAASKNVRKALGRAIFVRDIYKQYYVCGVNTDLDSINKLLIKLKELTEGYRVVTVGSSAGGYMAMLVAENLGATDCFCFSGQVSLYLDNRIEDHPFLKRYADNPEKNKWYDIINLVKTGSTNIWYFYPFHNEADKDEFGYIKDGEKVNGFAFALRNHAETMYAENMKHIICLDAGKMERLYRHYAGKVIGREAFLWKTASFSTILLFYKKKVVGFIKRRLKT